MRALLCALACATAVAVHGGCSRGPRTRIVLVTLDTLRYDRFEGPRASMPALRGYAERGARFEQCYSATSTTQPTHATIFTGLEPWQHGVTHNGAVLDSNVETLAERLRDSGFATAAVVASFPLSRRFGFDQGFDTFVDEFSSRRPQKQWSGVKLDEDEFYSLADSVADSALREIDAARGRRQFFWFHFYDAHAPYGDSTNAPVELAELNAAARERSPSLPALLQRAASLYDADVAHLDGALRRVLDRLARDADEFETHVIVTSDHGEAFGEDGSLGHGKRLSRAEVHVPLFIVSPRIAAGVRTDTVGSIDLHATIADLAGLSPGKLAPSGRDLLASDAAPKRPTVGMRRTYAKPFDDVRVTGEVFPISGPWFYVVKDGRLYVGDDREVHCESADGDSAFEAQARELFGALRAELEHARVHEDLDPETIRKMEALGYTR